KQQNEAGVPDLNESALSALDVILGASELRYCWEDTDDYKQWKKTVSDLRKTLLAVTPGYKKPKRKPTKSRSRNRLPTYELANASSPGAGLRRIVWDCTGGQYWLDIADDCEFSDTVIKCPNHLIHQMKPGPVLLVKRRATSDVIFSITEDL